jgi:cytochrome c oxidase subunit 2
VPKFWSLLFGVVLFAELMLFVIAKPMNWWLPRDVSSHGADIDNLFYVILYITGFFFVLTEAVLVYNMWRFSGDPGRKPEYTHGNHTLELAWTIVPAGILLFVAFAQVGAWERIKYQSRMPQPEEYMAKGEFQVVEVSARQFEWRIRYPSQKTMDAMVAQPKLANTFAVTPQSDDVWLVNELHVWKGTNVRVYLRTRDVLHSFFLPNLRIKQDAVPGKTIPVWFQPTDYNTVPVDREGKPLASAADEPAGWKDGYDPAVSTLGHADQVWDLGCAELCGWGHYKMKGKLFVHKDIADFRKWLEHAEQEQDRHELPK